MKEIWPVILDAAQQLHWSEIGAVVFNIIYLLLAMRQNRWCWPFGIVASLLSIYLFVLSQLYAESILYIYYVLAGIYGWYAWKGPKRQSQLPISTWSLPQHFFALVGG